MSLNPFGFKTLKALMRVHVLGNLVAFMLISVHFTYWITSVGFMGTGLALFIAVFTLVATGLLQRFTMIKGSRRQIRFLHVSMTTAFYLIFDNSHFEPSVPAVTATQIEKLFRILICNQETSMSTKYTQFFQNQTAQCEYGLQIVTANVQPQIIKQLTKLHT